MNDIDASEDYKKLIKAVIDYSITSYIKLQHPLNRVRKPQQEDFLTTLDVFYNPDYTFEHFVDLETNKQMNTEEMITFMLDGNKASMSNTQKYIVSESIDYWWTKNFHDITVPEVFTVCGKVYRIINSPNNIFVDKENYRIYLPMKKRGADRIFFKLVIELLLEELNINLNKDDLDNFYKFFYLMLKVNGAFNK